MSIKSKKWYRNQIKALEHACDKLSDDIKMIHSIHLNNLPEAYKETKDLKQKLHDMTNDLNFLLDEYGLYYR